MLGNGARRRRVERCCLTDGEHGSNLATVCPGFEMERRDLVWTMELIWEN